MGFPTIPQTTLEMSDWMVVLALALPHLLYAYIWFYPQQWKDTFKGRSVDIFASIAGALKGEKVYDQNLKCDHLPDMVSDDQCS